MGLSGESWRFLLSRLDAEEDEDVREEEKKGSWCGWG